MKKIIFFSVFMLALISFIYGAPIIVRAGEHANCSNCHLNPDQKDYQLIAKPQGNTINAFTGKPYGKSDALCMGCHDQFKAKSVHPVGITPKKTSLPSEARGFSGQENQITCCSCHDPHPENTNYMYLRWTTETVDDVHKFCVAKCHVQFAKPVVLTKRIIN